MVIKRRVPQKFLSEAPKLSEIGGYFNKTNFFDSTKKGVVRV